MSTNDVPGHVAQNKDVLAAGCWAEHQDGSLIYVKGTENGTVVYEIYDMVTPPVYYQDAMLEAAFKDQFSFPPAGKSPDKWTWHDKTPFPWSRVMKTFDKPRPAHADVMDQQTAAERVAESLKLRARRVQPSEVEPRTEQIREKGKGILERLTRAFDAFVE